MNEQMLKVKDARVQKVQEFEEYLELSTSNNIFKIERESY
jgi:hypothetical protein